MPDDTGHAIPPARSSAPTAPAVARVATAATWALFLASLVPLALHAAGRGPWRVNPLVHVDGLTVVLWTAAAFVSGIVHSYAKRYLAGTPGVKRFFTRLVPFTLAVGLLVAADHLLLLTGALLAMGLAMADLVGYARDWPQAQAAARLARRRFLAASALLGGAAVTLWWATGAATVTGVAAAAPGIPTLPLAVAGGALLMAAALQSALLPFQTWLLSSMTAPTPASALMHAGFVNAGGILLARFAPVLLQSPSLMAATFALGAVSALAGRAMKTVRSDVKGRLGCSTTSQMGFMIMQAGLGFFAAAITHLVLHGFYKAYLFLSSGTQVHQAAPEASTPDEPTLTAPGAATTIVTAAAGGLLFAQLTGKGTHLDGGLLLMAFVVAAVLRATRTTVRRSGLPTSIRYGAIPLLALPAIALYALTFRAVEALMGPASVAPVALGPIHHVVAAAFALAYVASETRILRRSDRLYVALVNAGQPADETILTRREEYDAR
jgi:NAD(P)H-quinone oxidoreductase subunit 5